MHRTNSYHQNTDCRSRIRPTTSRTALEHPCTYICKHEPEVSEIYNFESLSSTRRKLHKHAYNTTCLFRNLVIQIQPIYVFKNKIGGHDANACFSRRAHKLHALNLHAIILGKTFNPVGANHGCHTIVNVRKMLLSCYETAASSANVQAFIS